MKGALGLTVPFTPNHLRLLESRTLPRCCFHRSFFSAWFERRWPEGGRSLIKSTAFFFFFCACLCGIDTGFLLSLRVTRWVMTKGAIPMSYDSFIFYLNEHCTNCCSRPDPAICKHPDLLLLQHNTRNITNSFYLIQQRQSGPLDLSVVLMQ